MLPDPYAEGGDRYGGGGYAEERYGMGADVGEERYGGGVAGWERYGVAALLYGDVEDDYGVVPVGDGRYAVPAGTGGYNAAVDGRYPVPPATWLTEFGLDWDYT